MSQTPNPREHSAPLTLLEVVFLEVMQRRDNERRYHCITPNGSGPLPLRAEDDLGPRSEGDAARRPPRS